MTSVLIIDNYDSFTYNLYQQVGRLTRNEPVVARNDAIDLKRVQALAPSHIIISPGPGRPDVPRDFGVCADVIQSLSKDVPILGVCLGHQGIVHQFGGKVVRAPEIVHGKTCAIRHDGQGLFENLPQPLEVMRYHSLIADKETLPACFTLSAQTTDGLIMGVRHNERRLFGLQFHPESIGTPSGDLLLENFLKQ